MQTDDLKRALALIDERLDRQGLVQARQAGDAGRHRLNDSLDALARGQTWTIVWGVAMCLLGVAAWRGSFDTAPGAFFSGIVVHAFGAATIAAGAVIKTLAARVDYGAPVVALQQHIARLQRAHVVAGMIVGLPWWFLWVPFLVVLIRALFGVDISASDPGLMLQMAGISGLGMIATWLVYGWAKGTGRSKLVGRFEKVFAGAHLVRAQARIEAIAAFERG